jgi:hypothetical protein
LRRKTKVYSKLDLFLPLVTCLVVALKVRIQYICGTSKVMEVSK